MDYKTTPKKGKNRHLKLEMVYDMDNIRLADKEARKGKSKKYGPRKFDKNREENLQNLRKSLITRRYHTMQPNFETRFCDTKVRVLSKVHYKYHIAHHAFMQVIGPTLDKSYYYESAASIKGRGIHYAKKHLEKYLRKHPNWKFYHTQLDFKKFYHYIVRQYLYNKFCGTFSDRGLRWFAHDIIWSLGNHNGLTPSDGNTGAGIGMYPVQPLINFYLNDFDRVISKIKNIKYIRYCDNSLLISTSKKTLEKAIKIILKWSRKIFCQPIHTNICIQNLSKEHPISFVGYKFYQNKTFIRNNVKKHFISKIRHSKGEILRRVLVSYKGWLGCCNAMGLWKNITHMESFQGFDTKPKEKYKLPISKKFKFVYKNKLYLWNYNQIIKDPSIPEWERGYSSVGMREKRLLSQRWKEETQ